MNDIAGEQTRPLSRPIHRRFYSSSLPLSIGVKRGRRRLLRMLLLEHSVLVKAQFSALIVTKPMLMLAAVS